MNPAQAISNRKIAEIRISQASSSGTGSPGRVLSARSLKTIIDVEAFLLVQLKVICQLNRLIFLRSILLWESIVGH